MKMNVIQFPRREYNRLVRREDYIQAMFTSVAQTALNLNIDLDDHDEFGAIFSMLRDIVNKHLDLYENFSEGS